VPSQQSRWTSRDDALLHTCRIANLMITQGDLSQVQEVIAPFRPQVPGEQLWSEGPFTLWDWRAVGDGSWEMPRHTIVDLALGPAAIVNRFVKIRRAQRDAVSATVPRWVEAARGTLFTSVYGFYLYTPQPQVYPWPWEGITIAELIQSGSVRLTGTNSNGPFKWLLQSDWAELVFVTWALTLHPKHPQLNSWLPSGWIEHARFWRRY
jgi:hypothetical protein